MRAHLRTLLTSLVVGVVVAFALAWILAASMDVGSVVPQTVNYATGSEQVEISVWSKPGAAHVLYKSERGSNWSPSQAAGPPDTLVAGDAVTAWASATADGQQEWLTLEYERAVVAKRIDVYESYSPGALVRVTAFGEDGNEVDVWQGVDPTKANSGSGVSKIPVTAQFKIRKLKLYLDSLAVSGWNEVDAVGLIDADGQTQWAGDVQASSWYSSGSYSSVSSLSPAQAMSIVPDWAHLSQAQVKWKASQTAIDARGWPMLALYREENTPMTTVRPPYPAALPLRPIWRGLAVDAVFFGVLIWIIRLMAYWPNRFVRDVSRMRHGRCISCGYNLNYNFVEGCPECGWRRNAKG